MQDRYGNVRGQNHSKLGVLVQIPVSMSITLQGLQASLPVFPGKRAVTLAQRPCTS